MKTFNTYENWSKGIVEYFNRAKVIDFASMVADHSTNLLLNNGYSFNTKNEALYEKFKEFEKENNFKHLLSKLVWSLSYFGRAILTISKDASGKPRLLIADQLNLSNVETRFDVSNKARIIQRVGEGLGICYLIEEWDEFKVIRNLYQDKEGSKLISNKEVDKYSYQFEPVWYHNLGFLPVFEIVNKPRVNILGSSIFNYYPDWINVFSILDLADDIIKRFANELAINHTYISMDFTTQELMPKYDADGNPIPGLINSVSKQYTDSIKDMIVNGNIIHNKMGIAGEQRKDVELFFGQSKYMVDTLDALERVKKIIFEGSGYSYSIDKNSSMTNDEVIAISKLDYQTIMSKKTHLQPIITNILQIVLRLYKVEEYENFNFQLNSVVAEAQTLEIIEKEVNLGLITEVEKIQKWKKLDYQQAKQWLSENRNELGRSDKQKKDNKGDENGEKEKEVSKGNDTDKQE